MSLQMELRSASTFSGGHIDDVDYISWNPTHPELFVTSSQKDKRLVFWDARRELHVTDALTLTGLIVSILESRYIQQLSLKFSPVTTTYSPDGRTILATSVGKQMYVMNLVKRDDDTKETWTPSGVDPVIAAVMSFDIHRLKSRFSSFFFPAERYECNV